MAGKPLKQDNTGVVTSIGGNLPRYENNSAEQRQHERGAAVEKSKMDAMKDPALQIANLKAKLASVETAFNEATEVAVKLKVEIEKMAEQIEKVTSDNKDLKKQLSKTKKPEQAKGAKVDKAYGKDKAPKEEDIVVGELKNKPAMAKPVKKEEPCECGEEDCKCEKDDDAEESASETPN